MEAYLRGGDLNKIIRIQAAWKGYQIRRVIQYLRTTQKAFLNVDHVMLESHEIFHAGRGRRDHNEE